MEYWSDGVRIGLMDYWIICKYRLSNLVPAHFWFNFLGPGVDAAAEAADVLQAVAREVGGGVEGLFALMVDENNGTSIGAFGEDFLHGGLREQDGAFHVHSLEFFAGTDVHEADRFVLLHEAGQFLRLDEGSCVLFVTGFD